MTDLAFKIVEVKRPISGARIGYRMVLATLNLARYDAFSGEYCQSFVPKYRVKESGDYSQWPEPEQVERFVKTAQKWHRFTRIIPFN